MSNLTKNERREIPRRIGRLTKEERRASLRKMGDALRMAREELNAARKKTADIDHDLRHAALASALDRLTEVAGKISSVPQLLPHSPVNVTFNPEPIRAEISRLSSLIGASSNTEPLRADINRLCELVASLLRGKPPTKYQALFKRNDFGQIVEAIIEPVEDEAG